MKSHFLPCQTKCWIRMFLFVWLKSKLSDNVAGGLEAKFAKFAGVVYGDLELAAVYGLNGTKENMKDPSGKDNVLCGWMKTRSLMEKAKRLLEPTTRAKAHKHQIKRWKTWRTRVRVQLWFSLVDICTINDVCRRDRHRRSTVKMARRFRSADQWRVHCAQQAHRFRVMKDGPFDDHPMFTSYIFQRCLDDHRS